MKDSTTDKYQAVRSRTKEICSNLETEDYVIQSAPFVSPPKWHLAHTTWFFEEFILRKFQSNYQCYKKEFGQFFNSYYKSVGTHWEQGKRGFLSRPTLKDVFKYRECVDQCILELAQKNDSKVDALINLGLHHEQQHQELLFMDIKYNFSQSPLSLKSGLEDQLSAETNDDFHHFDEGIYEIGNGNRDIFSFDNEGPRHKVFLRPFKARKSLVRFEEYLEFIETGAYQNHEFWHSDFWAKIQKHKIQAPLYWLKTKNEWKIKTLQGDRDIPLKEPISHVNYYEAHAFATWKSKRLLTEAEWEVAFSKEKTQQLWQWTESAYLPYPGYKKPAGAFGEYNSKFMCGQMVLRGGCFATPKGHFRPTYRNFYYPGQNWMFSGIRLAEDKK